MKKQRLKTLFIIIACIFLFLPATACAEKWQWQEGKLKVAATTTMLADLCKQIGGDYVHVYGLMKSGVDPHGYYASEGDVLKLQQSDIMVYNGLGLEGKLAERLSVLQNKPVLSAADNIHSDILLRVESGDKFDPHIWFDVGIWKIVAENIEQGFSRIDPLNQLKYKSNLQSYLTALDELESYIHNKVLEVEPSQRVLITAHDAFGYFGRAYGFEVKGIQGINTESSAGIAGINSLADFIVENKIRAVFVESSVNERNLNSLKAEVNKRGLSLTTGGTLYSDSIGDSVDGNDTYIKAFKANVDTIINALK